MFLKIFILFACVVSGFAQFYPGYGPGQAMNPRGMGDFYPPMGYPYPMPRYIPNYFPGAPPYPGAMGFGAAGMGGDPPAYPPPLMSASDNTNENANTNVNINSGTYRRSLHNPSKEHSGSRNANKNTNVNMSS